jgi:hypothetical protein
MGHTWPCHLLRIGCHQYSDQRRLSKSLFTHNSFIAVVTSSSNLPAVNFSSSFASVPLNFDPSASLVSCAILAALFAQRCLFAGITTALPSECDLMVEASTTLCWVTSEKSSLHRSWTKFLSVAYRDLSSSASYPRPGRVRLKKQVKSSSVETSFASFKSSRK